MRCLVALALTATVSAGAALATSRIECVAIESVDAAPAALVDDPDCTIAAHALAATVLPDLAFGPPLCFVTTFTGTLSIDGRPLDGLSVVAYSGLASNRIDGRALAPMPSPLVDGAAVPRPLIPFATATIIEVRAIGTGKLVGQLVSRDTGWAELDLATARPKFASERLVITHAAGRLFTGARGEIFFTGDQFGVGGLVHGSLCGPQTRRRVAKIFR